MSISKARIAIYSNLPSGGAAEKARLNFNFFNLRSNVIYLSDSNILPKNLLHYLYICIIKLPQVHSLLSKKILDSTSVLIAYHSWLTKSPHILRYWSASKIYICEELMREYYDKEHIKNQSIKERIVNVLRLPIKYIDRQNLKSPNTTIIVNSHLSKTLVDRYYNVSSIVIYPGIDTKSYFLSQKISKRNQVISVGAINKLKRYEFIVRVLSKIPISKRPELVIVGNGADTKYLNHIHLLAKTLKVNLTTKINISKSELVYEYHKSKLFIYASINEPFGIVVEEAMAAKLPLVVYGKGGGYSEILDNNNGLILENLNLHNWAKGILHLLNNEILQAKQGSYNTKYVKKNFDAKIMNERLWKIVKSL